MAPRFEICPHCGAENLADAEWCGQCFAVFRQEAFEESAQRIEAAADGRATPHWVCAMCHESNPLTADRCRTCATPIFESFGPAEVRPVVVDRRAALTRSLWFPGLGFRYAGDDTTAVAVGVAAVAAFLVALIEFSIDRTGLGILLLIMTAGLWIVAARDAVVLAGSGDRTEMWLRPRILTAFGIIVGLILFFTLIEAIRLFQERT